MLITNSFALLTLLTAVLAAPISQDTYKPNVKALFKRAPNRPNDQYPRLLEMGPKPLDTWVKAYEKALKAGRIAKSPEDECPGCTEDDDIIHGPPGTMGVTFDDGPQPAMTELTKYLSSKKQIVTHFVVGQNVKNYTEMFTKAVDAGHEISVHTWSHPHMPTLTPMQILGEIGWTMQIIYDKSDIIPAFWRPPYGEADNIVRSIAKNVFGLSLIHWTSDPDDWCLNEQGVSSCKSPKNEAELRRGLKLFGTRPKSKGQIILEHVTSTPAVKAFEVAYPFWLQKGWKTLPIGKLLNRPWRQN